MKNVYLINKVMNHIEIMTESAFLAMFAPRFHTAGKLTKNPHINMDAVWLEAEINAKKKGIRIRDNYQNALYVLNLC